MEARQTSDTDLVNKALQRFKGTLQKGAYVPWRFYQRGTDYEPAKSYTAASVKSITVQQVKGSDDDESYSLTLAKDGTTAIKAATAEGAMHGLNSLAQLFYKTSGGQYYTKLAPVSITDKPTYGWRGLNVDIARNYQSPDQIKRLIDGLAFNKFNRLHIHATDSQSWPIEIPSLPNLAKKGAYSPELVWSAQALKDVQTYALERGIQSVIEIDSPGHTASIHWSEPELIVGYNEQPWGGVPSYCNEPPCGQVKLNNKAVKSYFAKIYKDLLPRVAPFSSYFHSGGDEVNSNVYALDGGLNTNDSTKIQPYLNTFMNDLHSLVTSASLKQLVWEEMILVWNVTVPTATTLVQSWQPGSLPLVLKKGYKALFGDYTYWYLDCGYGQWIDPNTTNPDTPIVPPYADYCSPQKSWRQIYAYDPRINVTAEEQKLIQGGEVHIWGELTDEVNLDAKVWPRASAAGEVMWSGPKGVAGVDESVTRRLADMRERLVGLGFAPQMVQMTWCLQNPGSCSL